MKWYEPSSPFLSILYLFLSLLQTLSCEFMNCDSPHCTTLVSPPPSASTCPHLLCTQLLGNLTTASHYLHIIASPPGMLSLNALSTFLPCRVRMMQSSPLWQKKVSSQPVITCDHRNIKVAGFPVRDLHYFPT